MTRAKDVQPDDGRRSDDAQMRERFDAALHASATPLWVGQVVAGVTRHVAHTLLPDPDPGSRLHLAAHSTARMVALLCDEQERRLCGVRTGRILRVVADGTSGAAFCLSVVPGERVVAFLLRAPDFGAVEFGGCDGVEDPVARDIDFADRALIDLVDGLRRDMGLRSQNPGGVAGSRDRAEGPEDRVARASTENLLRVAESHTGEPSSSSLREAMLAALAIESVQWVARIRGRGLQMTADVFDDPALNAHFRVMDRAGRRWFYELYARESAGLLGRFNRLLRPVLGGPVRRLLLDVEQGVIVVERLTPRDHLMGVTLDQARVGDAERTMRRLAAGARSSA